MERLTPSETPGAGVKVTSFWPASSRPFSHATNTEEGGPPSSSAEEPATLSIGIDQGPGLIVVASASPPIRVSVDGTKGRS
jgi:hypothetical protein